ncbi:HET-domain-containing protein [Karstenula rhodostoma CBS 690.94]|uniref:HET-domain-containing protein n=1 Tax=Karstenula rhodostoma CBS 690.94 TaxID=1392251 RepID=A0A9P4PB74_9PLEO|nr:HET-domain-containing protein [Karstenula rhodostoma CBS 690.94]
MSSETHLCNRCLSMFSRSTDLPTDIGPEEYISSGPDGESGRQWEDKTTRNSWTEVCGMFHEGFWDAKDVSKAALVRSAEEGCYICVRIWREYSTFTNEGIQYPPGSLCTELRNRVWVYYAAFPKRASHFTAFFIISKVAPTTRSQQTMTQAKTWINDCKKNHMECQREETHYDLPTRLVRISYAGEGEMYASLCRGSTLPSGTQYLTLSHLWGKHEFLKLMRENIGQWGKSIPTNKLSQTFQDALYMTYSLGFRFLWIDSLCIIQDDLQDWEQESQAMCRIYKGAVCNIAASARQTSEGQGFLPSSRSLHPVVPPLDLHTDELYGRAWVLQEQMLALRTLHCQGDQIYWECRTSMCNEVWPSGWAESLKHRYRAAGSQVTPIRITPKDIEASQEYLPYIVWLEMVSHYSRRAISYTTDRLPALAGIAADMALLLNDTYTSGIWQKALHNGVLYQSRGNLFSWEEPPEPHPMWDKVPSWSWASLGRPVVFTTTRHPPETKRLCDIEVLPATHNQLSVLQMTGPLMRLDWVKNSPDAVECQAVWEPAYDDPVFHRMARDEVTWEFQVHEDHWFAQKCYSEFCIHPIPQKEYGQPSEKPYFAALFDNVFFMPVLYEGRRESKTVRSFHQYGGEPRITGLLLWAEPGQTQEKGRAPIKRVFVKKTHVALMEKDDTWSM